MNRLVIQAMGGIMIILLVWIYALETNVTSMRNKIDEANESIKLSEQLTTRLMKKSLEKDLYHIKVTGYHPWSGGINSDSNPAMTSTMTPHKAGRTCAISTELVEAGWLGKEIYIDGYGMMVANDRLSKKIKGKQIDLCKGTLREALAVGNNHNVLATLVDRKNIKKMMEE